MPDGVVTSFNRLTTYYKCNNLSNFKFVGFHCNNIGLLL